MASPLLRTANAFGIQPLTDGRLRIIVLGYIVRGPLGGLAWHHLQYVMGLVRLGHEVYFVEDSDDYPSCYDPMRGVTDTDPTYGLQFTKHAFEKLGLGDCWAYFDAHRSQWLGPCSDNILSICLEADLLLNISGMNPLRPWLLEIPRRVLIDTDPVFTQIRHLSDPSALSQALQHTAFLSFGENIDSSLSTIPDDGLPWKATRQPIVLDAWPITPEPAQGMFTTVMQWNSYPARQYQERRYGMKSDSFAPYLNLPEKVGTIFELAVGRAPHDLLSSRGWVLRDSLELTRDPWTYQSYIQQSKAEFSVAKHGYVVTHSGWFSERSACYLASGRPVLTQETGFSQWLETGSGIIPFSTSEEVMAGIEEINSHYEFHCRAARGIAEEFFEAGKILSSLLE